MGQRRESLSGPAAKHAFARAGPALAVLAALALARPVLGQDPEQDRWQVVGEPMELRELVEFCAGALGVGIDYQAEKLAGSVTIRSGPGLSIEGIWATTNRHLAAAGFACVQIPGEDTLSVVPLDKAARLARVEPRPDAAQAGYIRVVRPLASAVPDQVAEAVKALLPAEGSVVETLATSGHLMVAGLAPQVRQAVALLEVLDDAPAETVVEEIPLVHVPPLSMASLLEQVAQKRKGVDKAGLVGSALANPAGGSVLVVATEAEMPVWRALVERFDQGEALSRRNYVPRRFGLRETAALLREAIGELPTASWKMVEDELTGTLIVTAPYGVHEEIEALLARIEAADPSGRRALRSFAVRHRDAEELLELLQSLLEEGAIASVGEIAAAAAVESPEAAPSPTEPAAMRVEHEESGQELSLSVDLGTNRIVAFGDLRLLDELGELIAALDEAHPQVIVETLVVGLNESQMRDLGVEMRAAGVSGDVLGEVSSLFGLGAPVLQNATIPPPRGTGATGVLLDPGDFSAVVRALEVVNHGRTVTIPKVLVANHEPATLSSVLQQPYTSTNASNTVATTSLGGTQDAGTTITVTPHITDGDRLRIDYEVSISNFVGESADPNLPPPRQENALDSTVTVPDGFTVVVGGLSIDTEGEAASRIPVLGRIPLLGALFRSTSTNESTARFFVFLRCTILRRTDFQDLRYLSARDRTEAGIEDDWPTLEPRVIR